MARNKIDISKIKENIHIYGKKLFNFIKLITVK